MIQNLMIDKPDNLNVARFLLVKFKCPFCRDFEKAIKMINLKLPIERRIQIIDCMHWERYGIQLEPIMRKFEKDGLNDGYPLCFITKEGIEQGLILEPTTPDILKSYLNKFLEEEFKF